MPEKPVTYANFPERELKVVIGPNINATITKTLRRMSIGTYEMLMNKLISRYLKLGLNTLLATA